jgi:hypothetical protein
MLRTLYTMSPGFYLNECAAPVEGTPPAGLSRLVIISWTSSAADRTVILVPPVGTSVDREPVDSVLVCIKVMANYYCGLDIEQFFT